jgi:putative transcriptional regulator
MAKPKAKKQTVADPNRPIGKELVQRLGRFIGELSTVDKLSDRFTCRTVKLNLKPTVYNSKRVKATREKLHASQSIFAQFLGVSASAVQDWEQDNKPPSGSACRLMDEIQANPDYWRKRLVELATPR